MGRRQPGGPKESPCPSCLEPLLVIGRTFLRQVILSNCFLFSPDHSAGRAGFFFFSFNAPVFSVIHKKWKVPYEAET